MEDGAVSPRGEVIGGANNLFDFYATHKCLPKDSLNTYIEKRDLRSYTTTDKTCLIFNNKLYDT
jgi:hypothetical protein